MKPSEVAPPYEHVASPGEVPRAFSQDLTKRGFDVSQILEHIARHAEVFLGRAHAGVMQELSAPGEGHLRGRAGVGGQTVAEIPGCGSAEGVDAFVPGVGRPTLAQPPSITSHHDRPGFVRSGGKGKFWLPGHRGFRSMGNCFWANPSPVSGSRKREEDGTQLSRFPQGLRDVHMPSQKLCLTSDGMMRHLTGGDHMSLVLRD